MHMTQKPHLPSQKWSPLRWSGALMAATSTTGPESKGQGRATWLQWVGPPIWVRHTTMFPLHASRRGPGRELCCARQTHGARDSQSRSTWTQHQQSHQLTVPVWEPPSWDPNPGEQQRQDCSPVGLEGRALNHRGLYLRLKVQRHLPQ